MNPIERESIQEMYNNFLTDLHIDPEFLGMLIQDKVLTTNIVGIIQVIMCLVHHFLITTRSDCQLPNYNSVFSKL